MFRKVQSNSCLDNCLRNVVTKLEESSYSCKNTHGSFLTAQIIVFKRILCAPKNYMLALNPVQKSLLCMILFLPTRNRLKSLFINILYHMTPNVPKLCSGLSVS